ncbi:hypothetical protein AXF42_Ash017206 [Apostasia shenzhenica]|uniref:Uncharacterized protein n=1 Tax=Apostasia shenzhenica TaxID=1088818 RepID=A0A2H9ZVD2_9ASPA|nr:hypothetical protein AXF42_Ash017206 [Apostasia shenzhenica]
MKSPCCAIFSQGANCFLIPAFCSEVNLEGNLILNLILRLPLLVKSLGIGMPSLGTISSYPGWITEFYRNREASTIQRRQIYRISSESIDRRYFLGHNQIISIPGFPSMILINNKIPFDNLVGTPRSTVDSFLAEFIVDGRDLAMLLRSELIDYQDRLRKMDAADR